MSAEEEAARLEREIAALKAQIQLAAASSKVEEEEVKEEKLNPYLMPEDQLVVDKRERKKLHALQFVEEGEWVKKADKLRMNQIAASLSTAESIAAMKYQEAIPDVEWWDIPILKQVDKEQKLSYDQGLNEDVIDSVIHTPPIPKHYLALAESKNNAPPPPEFLTEQEKRKAKRKRNEEKQKQKQEMISLGLAPPPEDRLTLKSFMRILGNEAIEDPTAVEAQVRAQMEKRKISHEMHNESRRLNPTQKKEKHRKKLQEDTSKEVISCVFKVADLSNPSHLFKVNINAEQYGLTGGIIMYEDCNLVIIEGGPKNTRKYTRLMLERIKWQGDTGITVPDDEDMDVEEDAESESSAGSIHCSLLWKSVSSRRLFSNFKTYHCPNEMMVRKVLADKGLSHLWELARNTSSSTKS